MQGRDGSTSYLVRPIAATDAARRTFHKPLPPVLYGSPPSPPITPPRMSVTLPRSFRLSQPASSTHTSPLCSTSATAFLSYPQHPYSAPAHPTSIKAADLPRADGSSADPNRHEASSTHDYTYSAGQSTYRSWGEEEAHRGLTHARPRTFDTFGTGVAQHQHQIDEGRSTGEGSNYRSDSRPLALLPSKRELDPAELEEKLKAEAANPPKRQRMVRMNSLGLLGIDEHPADDERRSPTDPSLSPLSRIT